MPLFKKNINYTPHNFNTSEALIDNNTIAESVISFAVEPIDDDYDIEGFPDGTAIGVELPSKKVLFTLEMSDASPTTDKMWDLYEAGVAFAFAFSDSNAPKLKANAQQCRFGKRPPVKREGRPQNTVWTFMAPYGEYRGGSYALLSV